MAVGDAQIIAQAVTQLGKLMGADTINAIQATVDGKADLAGGNTFSGDQDGVFLDRGGAVHNVHAYGAVGDGSTDDTAAWDSAIAAANAAGGGVVCGAPGRSYIVQGLDILSGVTIDLRGCTMQLADAMSPDSSDYPIIKGRDVTDIGVVGGISAVLDGNRDNQTTTREHWHCIDLRGCSRVTLDVRCINAHGDGLYLGGTVTQGYCEDISGRVVAEGCYRQGVSIVSVRNCDLAVVTRDISGTAPQAGVDIEPNAATDRVEGVELSVYSEGCAGGSLLIALQHLDATSRPVDIRVRKLHSYTDAYGPRLGFTDAAVPGAITFDDVLVDTPDFNGIRVNGYGADAARVEFRRVLVVNANESEAGTRDGAAVTVFKPTSGGTAATVGNIHFGDVEVRDNRGTARTTKAMYLRDENAAAALANISVGEIRAPDLAVADVLYFDGAGAVREVGALDYDINDVSFTLNRPAHYRRIHNASNTATRVVTLDSSIPAGWPDVTFEVRAAQVLRITPDGGSDIRPLSATAGKYVQSNDVGARLTLRRFSPTQWRVVEMLGTWTVEP